MGLFDKKYCDICGEKIGLLGNRKLENGNLCKDVAGKLSPFFSDRRNATVEEIKAQLAYREKNREMLAGFSPYITFDGSKKVYIDPAVEYFIVTGLSDWRSGNPDLIHFSQVMNLSLIHISSSSSMNQARVEEHYISDNAYYYSVKKANVGTLFEFLWFDHGKQSPVYIKSGTTYGTPDSDYYGIVAYADLSLIHI